MAVEVILPKVDMDMATGQISRWFFKEGDAVRQGDVLFEIETDKASMEIDAPASGILRNITGKEGVDIPVGHAVAWIYAEGEDASAAAPAAAPAAARAPAAAPATTGGGTDVVRAPMVGTFYRSASPGAPPFVDVGSKVKKGDPICIIEVMKLFTTIHAEWSGTVSEIGPENAQLVEYGQMLFVIAPE